MRVSRALPLARLWALAAVVTVALPACGLYIESAPPALPSLEGSAQIRDDIARTEAAAQGAAQALADKATRCAPCKAALTQLATESQGRLDAIGGLWDPWGQSVPEGARTPPPVADGPVTVDELVTFLVATAHHDLNVAAAGDLSGDEAVAIARMAAGRLSSAHSVAKAYGLDPTVVAPGFQQTAARLGVAQPNGGWSVDGMPSGVTDWPQSFASGDAPVAVQAVNVWDCVAQSMAKVELVDETLSGAGVIHEELFARADRLLSAGITDQRQFRCSLPQTEPSDLATAVLNADIALFAADDPALRRVGVQALVADINRWAPLAPSGLSAALAPLATAQSGH
ncbi:MAG: hypothetical protein Q4C87_04050 [Actinomycetaceae bacterium]|nr:hypothetical protein [Actinomycetaceae bacterium]